MPLDPIVHSALTILLEHARLADGAPVIERALEYDVAEALHQRAVRVTVAVGKRVMLTVTRHPLLGHDRRRQPEPEPHRQRGEVMQPQPPMCLSAVEKERYTDIGEVAGDDDEQDGHPPSGRPNAETWHCVTPQEGNCVDQSRFSTRLHWRE